MRDLVKENGRRKQRIYAAMYVRSASAIVDADFDDLENTERWAIRTCQERGLLDTFEAIPSNSGDVWPDETHQYTGKTPPQHYASGHKPAPWLDPYRPRGEVWVDPIFTRAPPPPTSAEDDYCALPVEDRRKMEGCFIYTFHDFVNAVKKFVDDGNWMVGAMLGSDKRLAAIARKISLEGW